MMPRLQRTDNCVIGLRNSCVVGHASNVSKRKFVVVWSSAFSIPCKSSDGVNSAGA